MSRQTDGWAEHDAALLHEFPRERKGLDHDGKFAGIGGTVGFSKRWLVVGPLVWLRQIGDLQQG